MAVENNSTVRWFTNKMPGAPELGPDPGSIIAILDACLIDGFGTASPDGNKITVTSGVATVEFSGGHGFLDHSVVEIDGATPSELNGPWRITGSTATSFTFNAPGVPDGTASGSITVKMATPGHWEKAFSDAATKAAYRSTHPDATGFYLRVDDSKAYNDNLRVPVRGYQLMTDIDTGQGEFPTFAERPLDTYNDAHSWARPSSSSLHYPADWVLVADERYFCFMPNFYYKNRGGAFFEFGDIIAAPTDLFACVTTGNISPPTYPGQNTQAHETSMSNDNGCRFAASEDGLTPGTGYAKAGSYGQSKIGNDVSFASQNVYPAAISNGYILHPVMAYENRYLRGFCPGLYQMVTKMTAESAVPDTMPAKVINRSAEGDRLLLLVQLQFGTATRNIDHVCAFDIEGPWR